MRPSTPAPNGRQYFSARQRTRLLAAFRQGSLSAAEFTRRHRIKYTTFCAWRRRKKAKPSVSFAEVELSPLPRRPVELVIELGAGAKVRIDSEAQLPLLVGLLQHLNPGRPC